MRPEPANHSDADRAAEDSGDAPGAASRAKEPGRPGRRFETLASLIRRLGPVGATLVAIISTLSAAVTLIYFFRPPETYAELVAEHAEWPVTLREFEPTAAAILREVNVTPTSFDEGQLNAVGAVIPYTATMGGYQGKECRVRWAVREEPGNRPLPDPALSGRDAWPIGALYPQNPRSQRRTLLWAPLPSAAGTYAVEIILHCDGEDVDSALQGGITVE